MRHVATLTAVVLSAGGCVSTPVQVQVDHFQIPCFNEAADLCLLIMESDDVAFQRIDSGIAGYEHTWGQTDTLDVIKTTSLGNSASAPPTWELVSVVSSEDALPGTRFNYKFDLGINRGDAPYLTMNGDGQGGTLFDGKAFTCSTPEVCTQISSNLRATGSLDIQMEYGDPVSGPIVAWNAVLVPE